MHSIIPRISILGISRISGGVQFQIAAPMQQATFLDGFRDTVSNFTGRLKNKATEKVADSKQKQEKEYQQKLLQVLIEKQGWGANDFEAQMKESYKSGTEGWKTYVPGYKDQAGIDELENILSILSVMTPNEKRRHQIVRYNQRQRIAQASGQSVEKVDSVLQQIHMIFTMNQWIQRRKKQNLALPETMDDVQIGMLKDRRGLPGPMPRWSVKRMHKKHGRWERGKTVQTKKFR
mmetsp:Transcript_15774/g.19561  ORF Transcript_15774/g.19561 Transcript_15774/m.19561 type:complete len:234 (-) Transcript_15774:808-1509(-)|eukprot:CAMPEP_0204824474 /NCGR_PEP_ID=MMETSP1346-20131115/2491_1 /ASSEMBLY_ACC=CAM_ASM_000771 /TAXON_ID=215587 /ORGANISM="Aplanochytrium stocchinoi, Strain GSBS06" /LENGTH=233 /DNA_ID=CAMNT_0051951643 /DNA_START=201 /DNA_END=902 /DNA_ORIENTATION=+